LPSGPSRRLARFVFKRPARAASALLTFILDENGGAFGSAAVCERSL